ncbi:hypothetical protein BGX26_000262 [Mortierella sp. AD094]|nr:hypothetical protein BGX26_000262 [Mortierella sp. AD094]
MTRMVGSKKEGFARIKRHHEAFADLQWNTQLMEPEALHRYVFMYASSACEEVLHVDPDDITSKPILLFIRSDGLAGFMELMDVVKGTSMIMSMLIRLQSPNISQKIPYEAVFIGGVRAIMMALNCNVGRSALNRIRIYGLDEVKNARPLRRIPGNKSYLVRDSTVVSELLEFREMIILNYDDDDDDQDNIGDYSGDGDYDDDKLWYEK